MKKCIVFLFFYMSLSVADAGVYRCIDENGEVAFSDRACEAVSDTEDFLPYVYEPTDPNSILEQEETLQNTQNTQNIQKKKKQAERQKKAAEKAAAKTERRLARCQSTQQKIKEIEAELRRGCKLRRCNTLKKQLLHRQQMQQRYCTPP